jgi:DNA-binding protein H-NS
MATLAALKKQMAALEAKVAKATQAEMGSAIAKVKKIMADFGLTVEHLASDVMGKRPGAKKSAASKAAKKTTASKASAKAKGTKAPKYVNPATGVTWSGVGRAPAWIVEAKNRDDFLITKPTSTAAAKRPKAAKRATKPVASMKKAMAAASEKNTARKSPAAKKASALEYAHAPAAAKKAASKKTVAKKAPAKRASAKKVANKAAAKKAVSKTTAAGAVSAAPTPAESAAA